MISGKYSSFEANLTLTFSIAGNGVVVVHSLGETFIEDASAWAAVSRPPPLPVEAGGFGFATRCAFLPGITVADRLWVHWVREHSLVHRTCGVSAWWIFWGIRFTVIQLQPTITGSVPGGCT